METRTDRDDTIAEASVAGYTIGELARQAGVTPRTIRYYTSEGLLPPPEQHGRYAHYSDEHLRRLRQIAHLKASYLPLGVIRERLAAGSGAPALPTVAHEPMSLPGGPRMHRQTTPGASAPAPDLLPPLHLGRYEFFPDLPERLDEAGEGESSAPQLWQRVILAPGVELHVREPLSAAKRRRLADLIRAARDALQSEE